MCIESERLLPLKSATQPHHSKRSRLLNSRWKKQALTTDVTHGCFTRRSWRSNMNKDSKSTRKITWAETTKQVKLFCEMSLSRSVGGSFPRSDRPCGCLLSSTVSLSPRNKKHLSPYLPGKPRRLLFPYFGIFHLEVSEPFWEKESVLPWSSFRVPASFIHLVCVKHLIPTHCYTRVFTKSVHSTNKLINFQDRYFYYCKEEKYIHMENIVYIKKSIDVLPTWG